MLEDFEIKKSFFCGSLLLFLNIKQIDSMLPCVCSEIDHRRRQNVVRTSVTNSATPRAPLFLFLPHLHVMCDVLLNRRMSTWNLFVKYTVILNRSLFIVDAFALGPSKFDEK